MGLIPIFPDAAEMDFGSLVFMMAVYGYILMNASKTISDGSEMLLLMYGPGIIGGLLIPILGAIPDCAVILISGLGSGTQEEIQQQLSVGVGTLVGSTVMLLTVPWAAGIYLGRRDFDPTTGAAVITAPKQPKSTKTSLTESCISTMDDLPGTAKIMMATSLAYLIIQIPAFFYSHSADKGISEERPYALTGVIVTFLAFCSYCYYQYSSAQASEGVRRAQEAMRREHWKRGLDNKLGLEEHQELVFRTHDKDSSGYIEAGELSDALSALGLKIGRRDVQNLLETIDIGNAADGDLGIKDGKISLNEFKTAVNHWVRAGQKTEELVAKNEAKKAILSRQSSLINTTGVINGNGNASTPLKSSQDNRDYGSNDSNLLGQSDYQRMEAGILREISAAEEEEEEEEEEDEFWHLTDSQLKFKALGILLLGTVICTVVSDPMVDVISNLGTKMNVSPFYISFVVTPLASNASEVIAGLVFARKKTVESISLTLSTLNGAATMNGTLALCIFMCLIYFRNLSWAFSAEVITVIFVLLVVGLNSLKTTIFLWQAVLVGSLYPLSILMVYLMETVGGLD
jgi:Ca2+/Na+ antiporter